MDVSSTSHPPHWMVEMKAGWSGWPSRMSWGWGHNWGLVGGWVGIRSSTRRCAHLVNPASPLLAGECKGRVIGMAIRHVVGWGRERGWWGLGRCLVIDETLCMSRQPRIPLIGRWKWWGGRDGHPECCGGGVTIGGWWGVGRRSVVDETLCASRQPGFLLDGRWTKAQGGRNGHPSHRWGWGREYGLGRHLVVNETLGVSRQPRFPLIWR